MATDLHSHKLRVFETREQANRFAFEFYLETYFPHKRAGPTEGWILVGPENGSMWGIIAQPGEPIYRCELPDW